MTDQPNTTPKKTLAVEISPGVAATRDQNMSDQTTLYDDELARDDPDLCEHGWSHLHPQSCPECEDESSSAKTTVRYVNAPTDVVRRMTDPRDSAILRVVQKPAGPGDMTDIEVTLRYELYAALLVRLYRFAERQDNGDDRVWLKQFLKDLRERRVEG